MIIHIEHSIEPKQFEALLAAIGEPSGAVLEALLKLNQRIKTMAIDLTKLTTEVSENSEVIDSARILLSELAQEIRDLKSQPDVSAAIDELASKLDAQTNDLAAAVAANTVAETPPVEPVTAAHGFDVIPYP